MACSVMRGRWEPYPLLELIEFLLEAQPTRADALPPERKPRFTYQVAEDPRDGPRVSLWIGQTKVELPPRRDVHDTSEETGVSFV